MHKGCNERTVSCGTGWLAEFLGQSYSQDAHPELHSGIFEKK